MSDWFYKKSTLEHKYNPLPEEARYKKKKKKKKIKKAKHKHIYEPCMYDTGVSFYRNGEKSPMLAWGTYCIICGRIGDIKYNNKLLTSKLPVYEIDLVKDKYVPIGEDSSE